MSTDADAKPGYWDQTRRPVTCLVFLIPLLAAYEFGVLWLDRGQNFLLRSGADAWLRMVLKQVGLEPAYVLPLTVVAILVVWQFCTRDSWEVSGEVMLGMVLESMALGIALLVIARLQDLAFQHLERSGLVAAISVSGTTLASFLGYLGAGIYEETIFRLMLLPALYYLLRLVRVPSVIATTVAVTVSGLAFSFAHYVGPVAEPFVWFGFIFRWLAGLFFAAVFVLRGFGVAVGAHVTYDLLVGGLGFQL